MRRFIPSIKRVYFASQSSKYAKRTKKKTKALKTKQKDQIAIALWQALLSRDLRDGTRLATMPKRAR